MRKSADLAPLGDHVVIQSARSHQFLVCAALRNGSVVDDQDLVRVLNGIQPVGDDQQCLALYQFRDRRLDVALVIRVDFKMHRAMEMRCCSPPERLAPPSPMTVSKPSGSCMMKS